jgi:hypothetical protein
MARYRVRLYGVPDKHLYDPIHLRMWHAVAVATWQRRVALVCGGTAIGLVINLAMRLLSVTHG